MTNGSDRQELIRKKAYAIWETEGRPHGQDERHWRQAEAEIETAAPAARPAGRKASATKPATRKSPAAKSKAEAAAAGKAEAQTSAVSKPAAKKTAAKQPAAKPSATKQPAKRRAKPTADPA